MLMVVGNRVVRHVEQKDTDRWEECHVPEEHLPPWWRAQVEERVREHERLLAIEEARWRRRRIQSSGGWRTICGQRVLIWCSERAQNSTVSYWRWKREGETLPRGRRQFVERADAIRDAAQVLSGVK